MKKLLFALLVGITSLAYSQVPQGINYQSVVRSTSGSILPSTAITVEFKLYNGLSTTLVYHETHSTTTNSFGMVNLIIGQGTPLSGSFNTIPWSTTNGIGYEVLVNSNLVGSKQLFMSVPYALHAGSAPAPAVSFTNNILSVGGNTTSITSGTTYTAGTGISVTGNTVTNTAPDQTVTITPAGSASVTGVYPNFTITTPTTQVYSAGNGIDISGGVISNTATAITPTITAGNNIIINPTTPSNSYTISAPSYSLSQTGNNLDLLQNGTSIGTATLPVVTSYSAGNGISIVGNVISNTLTPVTPTITSTGIAVVTPTTGNNFNLSVPQPTLSYNTIGNVLSLTHDGTTTTTVALTGTSSSTVSVVGSGLASVTPTTGSTFTVSVPNPTISIASGSLSISNGNSVAIPSPSLTINSNSLTINGPGGNTVVLPSAPSTSLTQGSNITIAGSAPSYTVSAPAYSITLPGGNAVQITNGVSTSTAPIAATNLTLNGANNNILSAGGNTVALNTYSAGTGISVTGAAPNFTISNTSPAVTPTITGTGVATVNNVSPNYTVNVPMSIYNNNTGVFTTGTQTIAVTPTLTLSGTNLQSGPATNTVNLSSINNWSVTSGVIYPSTLTNSVGVGINNSLGGRLGVSHTSSPASPHINIISPTLSDFGRVKFTNNGSSRYFSFEARNNTGGVADAFNIAHNNGTNERQVFLINGDRNVFINNLNLPLTTFHVMTSTATAQGGIASEGFAQAGQLNLTRNNNAGAGLRTQVLINEELGKLNFSGHDGTTFGDGAKIYAKATENVTTGTKGTELIFAAVPTGTNSNKDAFKINGLGQLEVLSSIRIPGSPSVNAGQVLTAIDALGNASWQTITAPVAAWTSTLGNTYLVNSGDKVGIGTNTPNSPFQVLNYVSFENNGSNTSLGFNTGTGTSPNNYYNTMVGAYAGQAVNTGTANGNTFVGYNSGVNNNNGSSNTFLGVETGRLNSSGSFNTMLGNNAGFANTNGNSNVFVGYSAGLNNTTGQSNTFIGRGADLFSATQYTNATAIGFNSRVDASDALVLGNNTTKVGIGTSQPSSQLHVVNNSGSQLKIGNNNQPTLEWFWDVDATSNLFLKNEGNGTTQTKLYFDYNSGNLGLGAGAPGYKLTVIGGANDDLATIYAVNNATSTTSASHGVQGLTFSTYSLSAGIFGNNNSVGPSVYGVKNGTQSGIAGRFEILNTANTADGVFVSNSGRGAAIHAVNGPTVTGSSNVALLLEDGHMKSVGTTPTFTLNALASGTGVIGTDMVGKLSFTVLLSAILSNTDVITVKFDKSYSTTPNIIIIPNNGSSYAVNAYVNAASVNGFSLRFANNSAVSTTYSFNYLVIE